MSYPPFHPAVEDPPPLVMSGDDFVAAFPSESQHVEFKSGVGRALQDTVVAFSNCDGGVILVGVDDQGGVAGRELTPGLEDDIHSRIATIHEP